MKTLKLFFSLFIFALILSSCTPQALDDTEPSATEDVQATTDRDANIDNGGKD